MAFYKDAKPGKHGYVSEIDEFFINFHQQRKTISESTKQEIAKHQKIAAMRDKPCAASTTKLWEDF